MRKRRFIKKRYGEYKTVHCPFCSRLATHKTETGLEVCHLHTKSTLEEIKCTCGSWLKQKSGKFGPYFNCINCGNFNFQKAMEIKGITMKNSPVQEKQVLKERKVEKERKERQEITISSNDVEYFD